MGQSGLDCPVASYQEVVFNHLASFPIGDNLPDYVKRPGQLHFPFFTRLGPISPRDNRFFRSFNGFGTRPGVTCIFSRALEYERSALPPR